MTAIFFLSTGRCGTQFFEKTLNKYYSDLVVAEHEPLGSNYECRKYFRTNKVNEIVEKHVNDIKKINKIYVETGWPCFSALPYIINELDDVKIIHIVKNPVKFSLSMSTHKVFEKKHGYEKCMIDSNNNTMYEKCLHHWTEHLIYSEELRKKFNVPWMTIKFEDLFKRIDEVIEFIGLPKRNISKEKIDKHQKKMNYIDWKLIFNHPRTIGIAKDFGFRLDFKDDELKRYFKK